MKKRTSIQLSQAALHYNIAQIKKAAHASGVGLVIKSNAYGHGLKEIAQMAQSDHHITWLCTAGIEEALHLCTQGIDKPLLALSYLDASLQQAIHHNIHVALYNLEDAYALNAAAQEVGKKAYVHIKIDTGMSRLGIDPNNAFSFINALKQLPHIELYGLFTHLCDTPNPDSSFSYHQLKIFDDLIELIEAAGIKISCTHAQSSSALCIKPARPYTFIRAGAAAYGIWKSEEHRMRIRTLHPTFDIKPVMQWSTHIIQLKNIPTGATVGYDRTLRAQRPTLLAIAPIGYHDGYARSLSNRGTAVINQHYAPVAGMVSMNMTAFDITDIPNVKIGDQITLIGDAPKIVVHEIARTAHMITNEIVTSINASIERKIVSEHQPLAIDPPHEENEVSIEPTENPTTPSL